MRSEAPAPYSRKELREIRNITSNKEATLALREDIFLTRAIVHTNPDRAWEEVSEILPLRDNPLETEERNLLHKRFLEFQQSRSALLEWEKMYKENHTATTRGIALSLQMPREIKIQKISFLTNACAVYLTPEHVDAYAKYLDERAGITTENTGKSAAFADATQYLEDASGNRCPVIFVPYYWGTQRKDWVKRTLEHEEEHTIFMYYEGTSLQSTASCQDIRVYTAQLAKEKIESEKEPNSKVVRRVLTSQLRKVHGANRRLFFNELIAEGASHNMDEDEFLGIADEFDSRNLDTEHPYARAMRQTISGLLDTLEATTITEKDKLTISWELERQSAEFVIQNYVIGKWMHKLWQSVNGNREHYVSSLYALSSAKPWQVGWFIGEDPEVLKQELIRSNQSEIDSTTARQMMLREVRKVEPKEIQPLINEYNHQVKAEIAQQLPLPEPTNLSKYKTLIARLYKEQYIPAYLKLTQKIRMQCEQILDKLENTGIICLPRETIISFTEDYLDTQLESEKLVRQLEEYLQTQQRPLEAASIRNAHRYILQSDNGQSLRTEFNTAITRLWEELGYDLDRQVF